MEIPKETSQKGCFSNPRHPIQQIDPAIQSLRTRITELEIANASVGTNQETLKEQFTLSQTKVLTLEKEVELLKKENLALNDIILELRKEFEQVASLVRSQKVLSRDDSLNISRETKDTSKMVSYNSTSSPIIDQLKSNNFSFSGKDSGIPVITVQNVEEEIPLEFIEEEKPLNYLVLSLSRKVSNSPANPFQGQNNLMSPNLASTRDSLVNPRKKTIVPNRNSRKKPNEKFTPEKFFENFLVIGATKERVSKQLNADASKRTYNFTNNQTTSIEGSILFNYAENRGLPSNATPAGIDKILASWDLLLTGYDIDSKQAEDSFFKVVLKGQKRYKKRYMCPFRPHTDEILLADWNDYSEMINPQNKLYALCIQKGDYVMVTDEATGKEHFVFMDTIYCLLTYYPIPQLCFNLLISVLNLIRKRRKELFWERYHGDRSKIDFSLLDTLFLNEVSNYLNNLHQLAFPSPNRTIKYDFNDGKFDQTVSVEYTCPSEGNACTELALWGAYNTFSSFSLKDISLILSTILLDKTVVFFSSDVTNLTATLNTFLALLFPFKYPFKIAPLMTTDMLYLFDNFQATILCVNRKEEYFWRKELTDFPHLFVFLDSKTIFIHEDNSEILDAPTLNFMIKPLEDVYKELNKNSKFEVINKLSALKTKMNSTSRRLIRENSKIDIENVQPEQIQKSQKILSAFRKRIESDIITYIRPFEGHNPVEVKEADMDKLIDSLMQDKKARKFFYELKKTCVFINYPQTVNLAYERQMSQK